MNRQLWLLAALVTVALISAGCGSSGPSGTGTANSTTTNFQITVQDNGDPGSGQDTFAIQLGTGYSKSGVVQGGTIEIH